MESFKLNNGFLMTYLFFFRLFLCLLNRIICWSFTLFGLIFIYIIYITLIKVKAAKKPCNQRQFKRRRKLHIYSNSMNWFKTFLHTDCLTRFRLLVALASSLLNIVNWLVCWWLRPKLLINCSLSFKLFFVFLWK